MILTNMFITLQALKTMPAGSGPIQQYPVPFGKTLHRFADCGHSARTFMAGNKRLPPAKGIMIRVAKPGRMYPDQHFIFRGFADSDLVYYIPAIPIRDRRAAL
jgi:hypothetical protein